MFTGIIRNTGKICKVFIQRGGKRVSIEAEKIIDSIEKGSSISCDGICLTVEKKFQNKFEVFISSSTLNSTKFKFSLKSGQIVNLEPSLKIGDEIGGHFILGHVDAIGRVRDIRKNGENILLKIEVPQNFKKYLYYKGSIAIDGISLTIQKSSNNIAEFTIIPFTYENTNFKYLRKIDFVNIEFDLFAKIVENIISNRKDLF